MRTLSSLFFVVALLILACGEKTGAEDRNPQMASRPNVLWIYLEDVSRWFGCYGDKLAHTPNIDLLSKSGVRFDRFYTSAGVCSAMRSGTITGMMQTTIGAHQHRSHRNVKVGKYVDSHQLPNGIKTIPEYFREAGYYTFNDGKDDFNFTWNKQAMYNRYGKMNFQGNEWSGCPKGTPFFGQIQLRGGKDKPPYSAVEKVDRKKVPVPPYYPDIPLVREEIAHHYDCIKWTDEQVGKIVAKLKQDNLYENTIIFLLSDHGYKLHRDKQFLYEGGINMAFMVAGPGIPAGQVRTDLVSSIDVGPTSMALAGIKMPDHFEGKSLFAADYQPREFVVSARDRCDYTIENIRAVVTPKFKYLRNFLTDRPYMQPSYKDPWPVSKELRRMMAAGEMKGAQTLFFGKEKPKEELYDLTSDPHEIHNLAADPEFAAVLKIHRDLLAKWQKETDDQGQYPETDAALLACFARWRERCVNPEFERVKNLVDRKPDSNSKKGRAKKQRK